MTNMTSFRYSFLVLMVSLASCGGGGGSGNGTLIEGTLTEARGVSHSSARHTAGERIADVTVCALGQCSVTDALGQWGFLAPESFSGGDTLFTVTGHEIDSSLTVTLPGAAEQVFVDLRRGDAGVEVYEVSVNGSEGDAENH